MSEKIPILKLGVVKEIVEATGMGISYAYEDLVFLDHNALLLQFTDESNKVLVHINQEADTEPIQATIAALKQAAQEREMTFLDGCTYALTQGEDEQISIEFISS
ncbi:hypothetical protein [Candidatus Electrothrix sp.]|uniref:hypothetical protein n=1 Tax=Candidatus Electrothrix sp. TaxID=2170559 RepID=UPI0040567088